MESAATYCGTVYPWQCDHVGHMNIMWYVGKFDEANWNMLARIGLPKATDPCAPPVDGGTLTSVRRNRLMRKCSPRG